MALFKCYESLFIPSAFFNYYPEWIHEANLFLKLVLKSPFQARSSKEELT